MPASARAAAGTRDGRGGRGSPQRAMDEPVAGLGAARVADGLRPRRALRSRSRSCPVAAAGGSGSPFGPMLRSGLSVTRKAARSATARAAARRRRGQMEREGAGAAMEQAGQIVISGRAIAIIAAVLEILAGAWEMGGVARRRAGRSATDPLALELGDRSGGARISDQIAAKAGIFAMTTNSEKRWSGPGGVARIARKSALICGRAMADRGRAADPRPRPGADRAGEGVEREVEAQLRGDGGVVRQRDPLGQGQAVDDRAGVGAEADHQPPAPAGAISSLMVSQLSGGRRRWW